MQKINYNDNVNLAIGAGGRAMHQFIEQLILKEFDNEWIKAGSDQAILPPINGKIAFSTDSYVVSPYFFNGGNIGSLAVNGTINDLSVGGATPLYISVGLILEEGLPLRELKQIIQTMATSAKDAGVSIVTGDTKVVERGKCDGIFINTSGVGVIPSHVNFTHKFKCGDKIIINGVIANHGMAIMAKRQGLDFHTNIKSDCVALNGLIKDILAINPSIRCMRDPTRGGVSATLNEWASFYNLGLIVDESKILVEDNVRGLCELLGLDPLHVANEGKVMIICDDASSLDILQVMKHHPLGQKAKIIGEVQSISDSYATLITTFGGLRRIDWLNSEQLPRIC